MPPNVHLRDGKKMSKRLKNYPDPVQILNAYGADALRSVRTDVSAAAARSGVADFGPGVCECCWMLPGCT